MKSSFTLLLLPGLACFLSWQLRSAQAFGVDQNPCASRSSLVGVRHANAAANDGDTSDNKDNDDDGSSASLFHKQLDTRANEIKVEKTRESLEEAHRQSFLKRRPRKLPYRDARLWVQANLGCASKDEFDDLVANGNLRTPYIPKSPEVYYTRTGEWISWEHFLRGCFDQTKPSEVKPSTGVFD